MKKYLYILILLGIFISSFFVYHNFRVLRFTKVLSSNLVNVISQELDGSIANSAVFCVDKDKYKIFIDNDLNFKFNKNKDQLLFNKSIENFIIEANCFKLTCGIDKRSQKTKSENFKLSVTEKIPVDFLFFSPKSTTYNIIFDAQHCFINFVKQLQ